MNLIMTKHNTKYEVQDLDEVKDSFKVLKGIFETAREALLYIRENGGRAQCKKALKRWLRRNEYGNNL